MYNITTLHEQNFWPVGEDIHIEWKNKHNDWHKYILLNVDKDSKWVFLAGRDTEDGEFKGNPFYVRLEEIDTIEVEQYDEEEQDE